MSRKLLFLLISVIYLILLGYGLSTVYSVGNPQPAKQTAVLKPDNKISIAHTEIFGKLERPQVIFDHKKHDEAFKKEGCKTCHPADEFDRLGFDFPKKVVKKDKKTVMNAYHDQCIDCHKKRSSENKKAGPVVCADCHKKELASTKISYPIFEFNFSYHDKHVKKLKEKLGKDDCSLCHHTYDIEEENEELALVYEKGTEESCYYCHELGKKRGPELTAITKVAAKKGLSIRKASHQQCLNCHLKYQEEYLKKGEKEACPTECIKCHTGKYKTVEELEKVPRPDRDQKEK
ncbi:MAG: cytochrome c3 family protein, partial [Nitrospirota bacterium]|nr:cytochrome c3 family protein [Nitrospirota bacterium]